MSLKDEMFSGEFAGDPYTAEDPEAVNEPESGFAGSDPIPRTEHRGARLSGYATDEEALAEEHETTSSRSRQERMLRRYQDEERTRIPDLISKVVSTEFAPRYRRGHKIGGEEGRKGKRGL
jgi:hypothetical protein